MTIDEYKSGWSQAIFKWMSAHEMKENSNDDSLARANSMEVYHYRHVLSIVIRIIII